MTPRIVVVGTSLGGLQALQTLLGGLDRDFPLPIAVVQHRGKSHRDLLANMVQKHTSLVVNDAEDKQSLSAGNVYIAPADYHLLVERDHCALSLEAPVAHSRPSVDVLFESAADTYGRGVIAVILTGSSSDGAYGASRVKQAGGIVIVQNPTDSEASAMPLATMKAVDADYVLRLNEIAGFLMQNCKVPEDGIHDY